MRPISAHRARLLLQLYQPNPTKEEIQKAFLQAAKKYHPDTCHRSSSSSSSAVTFRQCLEAREILLQQQQQNRFFNRKRTNGRNPYYASPSSFAFGFPTRKLRLLSLKQNLTLRGMAMASLLMMAFYDEYISPPMNRDELRRKEAEEYVIKGIPKPKRVEDMT